MIRTLKENIELLKLLFHNIDKERTEYQMIKTQIIRTVALNIQKINELENLKTNKDKAQISELSVVIDTDKLTKKIDLKKLATDELNKDIKKHLKGHPSNDGKRVRFSILIGKPLA